MAKKLQFVGKFSTDDSIPAPSTASVGQTIVVKAVDENGKPTEWEAASLPEQIQPDWNQNDSTQPDYIKNRIAYAADEVILDETLVEDMDTPGSSYMVELSDGSMLEVGKTYTVTTDSGTFTAVCKAYDADIKYIGNVGVFTGDLSGGESYAGVIMHETLDGTERWTGVFIDIQRGNHMKIVAEETVVPIDPKYLPEGGVGYTEPGQVELYSVEDLVLPYSEVDNHMIVISPAPCELVIGQTYTVNWNGIDYELVASNLNDYGIVIGDVDESGSTPFQIWYLIDDGTDGLLIASTDNSTEDITVDVFITTIGETIHPIDPKYLPKGSVGYTTTGELLLAEETTTSTEHVCSKVVPLAEGETYRVVYNGAEYIRTTYYIDGMTTIGDLFLNVYNDGDTESCDPFSIMYIKDENGDEKTVALTHAAGNTVSVYSVLTHKIDPEYLPGVCLPVVTLTDISELSEAVNAKLTECIGSPVIIKLLVDTVECACLASYSYDGTVHKYIFSIPEGQTLRIHDTNGPGIWSVTAL